MYEETKDYNPEMPSKRQRAWQEDQPSNHHINHDVSISSGSLSYPHSHVQSSGYEDVIRHEASYQGNASNANTANNMNETGPPSHHAYNRGSYHQIPPTMLLTQPSDQNFLSKMDYLLCSNIEMFSSSYNDVQESTYNTYATSQAVTIGQLGLRCIHCSRYPQSAAAYATVYPASIETMNNCIEMMAEKHITKCERINPELRDDLISYRENRKRRREGDEEDNLIHFCCEILTQRSGISNIYPIKSGVLYGSYDTVSGENWHTASYQDERGVHHPHHYSPLQQSESSRRHHSSSAYHGPSRHGSSAPRNSQAIPQYMHSHPHQSPQYSNQYGPPSNVDGYSHSSQHSQSHSQQVSSLRYDISQAFVPDNMGGWCCRYCSSVPYHYRAPGSVSHSPNPPNPSFIEHHLSICPGAMTSIYNPPHSSHQPYHHPSHHASSWHSNPGNMMIPPSHHEDPVGGHTSDPHCRPSSPHSQAPSDAITTEAIQYLMNNPVPTTSSPLVFPEDKALLTSYFYHLMAQLQLCRFSESDRKTRGGKRENVKIGFGGIECKHCANVVGNTLSRKFFWSNVDRLANSFAEIPSHVLKCRNCPAEVKSALGQIKLRHSEQMTQLPRGSQKVFFRRMWRRMHTETKNPCSPNSNIKIIKPIPLNGLGVPLAIPNDHDWLSDMDCFVRKNIEAFCATENDIQAAQSDRKYPIHFGQVGIRCRHCSRRNVARGSGVSFPQNISGIYESVREFQRLHLESCENFSDDLKNELKSLKTSTSLSSVLRKYYVMSAKALGMIDTQDGVRSRGEIVPIENFLDMIHDKESDENNRRGKPRIDE